MNKKTTELFIEHYNSLFEDYKRQMIWLLNKQEFSQNKKYVILQDINQRIYIELLRIHEHLKDKNDLPSLFSN